MTTTTEATVEELYNVPGKAEIVNGEIILMSPTGDAPSSAATEILVSLHAYGRRTRSGRAYGDNVGFRVELPNRKSFSPDVCFHTGERTGMRFLEGAPVFEVEVRSENDYGPLAEREIASKRADYFSAGTLVVWDVDLLSVDVITSYDADHLDTPIVYRRDDIAKAELALPTWEFPVNKLFE